MSARAPRELGTLVLFEPVFDRGVPRVEAGAAPVLAARLVEEVAP